MDDALKEKFSEYAKLLPDLRRIYFPGDFFFNNYSKDAPVRIGCRYSRSPLERGNTTEDYIILTECFRDVPEIDYFCSERIGGQEVLFGYVPDFPLAKKLSEGGHNFASITHKTTVTTAISLKNVQEANPKDWTGLHSFYDAKKDDALKEFLLLCSRKKNTPTSLPLFDFIKYLPAKVGDWELATIFATYQGHHIDGENHLVSVIQGNYGLAGKYLNVVLRFIYKMSEGKISIEQTGTDISQKGLPIKKSGNGAFFNIAFSNTKNNYSITVGNNETTPEFRDYESCMEALLLATIEKLRDYDCMKQTANFIGETERLARS
ncbi:MAG: hypothetical protein JW727_02750 [Candidatus Aenigmarchaeota archaeon]|nr:hypothetical protein [Candidatus Aenigmarchaeota archaeon]